MAGSQLETEKSGRSCDPNKTQVDWTKLTDNKNDIEYYKEKCQELEKENLMLKEELRRSLLIYKERIDFAHSMIDKTMSIICKESGE